MLKKEDKKGVILQNVDKYRVVDPMFEGLRVILTFLGEKYSPAYIQGIAGTAFRIAGICPCAPTCCASGEPTNLSKLHSADSQPLELLKLLGYEYKYFPLSVNGLCTEERINEIIDRVKNEIKKGRPVLVWNAFTILEWDVVTGFDDEERVFYGRGSYAGLVGYAKEPHTRLNQDTPAMGAVLIGKKTGSFDPSAAEIAALKEAVRHARYRTCVEQLCADKWTFLEGIQCYDRWVDDYKNPEKTRSAGDAYCSSVYRSTHRSAGAFLQEIAPKYPISLQLLVDASECFAEEADYLDQAAEILGWVSPEGPDQERNFKAVNLLSRARDCYAKGIENIESALNKL